MPIRHQLEHAETAGADRALAVLAAVARHPQGGPGLVVSCGTAITVERGAPGIYNIVDDEPAPVSEWLPALAAMLGARPPWRIPKWLARIAAGEHIVTMMTEVRAGSNAKAKRALFWQPKHASWRQGFAEVLSQSG